MALGMCLPRGLTCSCKFHFICTSIHNSMKGASRSSGHMVSICVCLSPIYHPLLSRGSSSGYEYSLEPPKFLFTRNTGSRTNLQNIPVLSLVSFLYLRNFVRKLEGLFAVSTSPNVESTRSLFISALLFTHQASHSQRILLSVSRQYPRAAHGSRYLLQLTAMQGPFLLAEVHSRLGF